VFLRTDTHWTPEGAEIAANRLAKTIADKFPLSGEPQNFVTEPAEKSPTRATCVCSCRWTRCSKT
jgi:alginate O-acetyltransferase complex protein AlgJ